MTRHATIIATGSYLPEMEVPNSRLKQQMPASANFFDNMETATGISTRFWAPPDWATSDLAVQAARVALERAGRRPEDVDLILLGTDSPDYITPATSVVVQHKLGATNAGTFDVGCACASFPSALATAAGLIATNPALNTVLVLGAYLMHKLAAPDDAILFFYGDGAGAAVLEPASEPGFVAASFQADGSYARHWGLFSGGTAEPVTAESLRAGRTKARLVERFPPSINNESWPRLLRRLARDGGFSLADIDLLLLTQISKTTIDLVMSELGLPPERSHCIMQQWGYTGSACIPMALDDAWQKGKLRPGALVAMLGSGVGYNQAAAAFRMR